MMIINLNGRVIKVTLKWSSAPTMLMCPSAFIPLPAGIWPPLERGRVRKKKSPQLLILEDLREAGKRTVKNENDTNKAV